MARERTGQLKKMRHMYTCINVRRYMPLGSRTSRRQNIIKMHVKDVVWDDVAQGDQWRAVLNMVMNFAFHKKRRIIWLDHNLFSQGAFSSTEIIIHIHIYVCLHHIYIHHILWGPIGHVYKDGICIQIISQEYSIRDLYRVYLKRLERVLHIKTKKKSYKHSPEMSSSLVYLKHYIQQ